MWRLANPAMLLWLLALVVAGWFVYRRRPAPAMIYAPAARLPYLPVTARQVTVSVTRAVFLAGIALTIIALARPQRLHSRIKQRTEALAIQMVVDISGSMAGLDFSPPEAMTSGNFRTRLDVVKELFSDFVGRRPNDLIGLVTFGGYAVSRVPLTFDHDLLRHVLADVEIPGSEYDRQGRLLNPEDQMTAIGDALALACARLADTNIATRIIVFLSDGESNAGVIEPETGISIARSMGIRVYSVAVGTEGRVPFLGRDMMGRPVLQHAQIGMDRELLERMATETGGSYYPVEDPDALEQALSVIDQLETTPLEHTVFERHTEKMAWPLGLGLLLILAAASGRCACDGEIV